MKTPCPHNVRTMRVCPRLGASLSVLCMIDVLFLPLPLDALTGVVRSHRWPRLTRFASSNEDGLGEVPVVGGLLPHWPLME